MSEKNEQKTRTTVWLDSEQLERAKAQASRSRKNTLSAMIRDGLELILRKKEREASKAAKGDG